MAPTPNRNCVRSLNNNNLTLNHSGGGQPVLPSPPFIDAPGLANLRDVGGYEIAGPSHRPPHQMVRRGLLYRSADPSGLTAEGVAVLSDQLGIKTVFDLRSVVELSRDGTPPTPSWDGSASVFVPIFLDKDYSPEALAVRFNNYSDGLEGFVRAYSSILAAAADPGHPHAPFRTIFESLASAPPSPLLVHCTAGKDKKKPGTGIFCALVLALCGVDDEAIAHDYSLTDLGLAQLKEATVQKLINGDALRGDRARAERMVSSRKENMLATLATLRATYGSVETYVTAHCGVPAAAVEQVRRNFIVNIDTNQQQQQQQPTDWRAQALALERELERQQQVREANGKVNGVSGEEGDGGSDGSGPETAAAATGTGMGTGTGATTSPSPSPPGIFATRQVQVQVPVPVHVVATTV